MTTTIKTYDVYADHTDINFQTTDEGGYIIEEYTAYTIRGDYRETLTRNADYMFIHRMD